MVHLIGQENHEYAIRTIFEMFQHPRLNKQVRLRPLVKTFLPPETHTYMCLSRGGGRNVSFRENFEYVLN